MHKVTGWVAALLLAFAWSANAQIAGGNIYGSVVDQNGGALPGVDVTLTAVSIGGQPRTTVTDASGQFRFLNLDAGTYKLATTLTGFNKMEREVIVTTGFNATIAFTMAVRSMEETVNVTAESPVVDVKKIGTTTTLTQQELQSTPQSKDPWALLKTVPGVIVDRVNVGGNESGQQSNFVGKGSLFADTMWNLDGVAITDTTSGGASSMYFDFDAFDEVAVNTGGNDLKVQTGGVGINFVTRRGTNQFRGSAKFTEDNSSLESTNLPSTLVGDPRLLGASKANHTDFIRDWGFDVGGPIVKDRLWFWGSYGDNDIKIIRLNQTNDETILKNTNAKVNWSATPKDEVSFFYFNGAKEKLGRSPGQAGTEDDSFLWNQGNFYPEEGLLHPIHGLAKIEDNHTFGSSLFVNAKYAWFGWGYGFAPRGGADQDAGINADTDHAYGSWFTYTARKPWQVVDVSGSSFKATKAGNHEFKFGFGYRRNPNHSTTRWSGSEVVAHVNPGNDNYALAYRARVVNYIGQVLRCVRRRHVHARTPDGQRRHPLGQAVGREPGQRGAREHDVPRPAAVAQLRRHRPDDWLERRLAADRRHRRARSRTQDRGARVVRELRGPAEPVRGDRLEPGRLVLHVHRLSVGRYQPRRVRAEERDPHQSRPAVCERRRSGAPDERVVAEHDRVGLPCEPRSRGDCRARSRARAEHCGRRGLHAAAHQRLADVESAHRAHLGRLHRDRDAVERPVQRRGLRAEPGEGRRHRRWTHPREPARLPFDLQRARVHVQQAPCEPVDGPRRLLDQRLARTLRWFGGDPESDAHRFDQQHDIRQRHAVGAGHRRRTNRPPVERIGERRHLLQRPMAAERQRLLSAAGRVRDRRQHLRPPGLHRAADVSS